MKTYSLALKRLFVTGSRAVFFLFDKNIATLSLIFLDIRP